MQFGVACLVMSSNEFDKLSCAQQAVYIEFVAFMTGHSFKIEFSITKLVKAPNAKKSPLLLKVAHLVDEICLGSG